MTEVTIGTLLAEGIEYVGFLGDAAGEVFDLVMSHPLPRLGLCIMLGAGVVWAVRSFIPGV